MSLKRPTTSPTTLIILHDVSRDQQVSQGHPEPHASLAKISVLTQKFDLRPIPPKKKKLQKLSFHSYGMHIKNKKQCNMKRAHHTRPCHPTTLLR